MKLLNDHSFVICRIKVIKNTKTGQIIFFLKGVNFFPCKGWFHILVWRGRMATTRPLLLTVMDSHIQTMLIFHSNVDLKLVVCTIETLWNYQFTLNYTYLFPRSFRIQFMHPTFHLLYCIHEKCSSSVLCIYLPG